MMEPGDKDAPKPPVPADKSQGAAAPAAASTSTRPKAVQAPAVTLPKGGGAIRGIGEKFSANPVTGGASLRIPLPVSPGRSGFQPELALAYDSGAGNGPFGAGFRLSVPQVSRKTDKGLPRYEDHVGSDVFVLSDAEDLVPSADPNDTFHDGTADEDVVRYRPRVEGLFARIERRRKSTGEVYWRAITRDRVISTYGRSADARIADPAADSAAGRRIFTWLLEETRDDRGNIVRYEYKAEDLANLPRGWACERNRRNGTSPVTANRYLKRVRYGNKVANPTEPDDFAFEVVFDYGEHDADAPTPDDDASATWPCRNDPFSTYRAGFEVRSYRLCRRVLLFHRFAELGAGSPPLGACLVASTDLTYEDDNYVLTKLVRATQAGYLRDPTTGAYTKKTYPPVELAYIPAVLNKQIEKLDAASFRDLPAGVDWRRSQWVDLDGDGLPGLLSDQDGAFYYKSNLGEGRFTAARRLPVRPTLAASGGVQEITDVDGDGRKELVEHRWPSSGFHERTESDGWAPFRTFPSQPTIDTSDPNVRFIDLSGDGHDDILMTTATGWTWFPSLAKGGYGPPVVMRRPQDDEKGPVLVFADFEQKVFLADMSGDGLVDLVRVLNGQVAYWPNLGYGRFGAKVTMGVPGHFDYPNLFHASRIRLADIDGSGTTDVLYLDPKGIRVYANQSGNRLAEPVSLPPMPIGDSMSTVTITDLFGKGTACLLWSSASPAEAGRPMRYIDLMGGKKPHLLVSIKNNLGLETRLEYASSTRFYLGDQNAGRPWITRLPFPVHVLTRVETHDAVSRVRLVSEYAYHHGYFDGEEREFRGFGLVEQVDTEHFSALSGKGLFSEASPPESGELPQPPVLTKTWFHTGAWIAGKRMSKQFESEYYAGDQAATLLPDTVLPEDDLSPPAEGLSPRERREACRALKGQVLRQEIYALDGTEKAPHPYTVSERSYAIRKLQGAGDKPQAFGVFYVHPREAIELHYERIPNDPRITHAFTLAVDAYGNVTRSAAVAYGRRPGSPPVSHEAEQTKLLATLTESSFENITDAGDAYRLGIPLETMTYELTGLEQQGTALLSSQAVRDAAGGASALDYEEAPGTASPPAAVEKRLIEHVRMRYYNSASLPSALPLGDADAMALPYETYALAFTPGLVTGVFGAKVTTEMLEAGGYVHLEQTDTRWWVPTGRQVFDAAAFYLPTQVIDPFGNTTSITYDSYKLLVTEVEDEIGNVVAADNDYRTLLPAMATDPNGNRAGVLTDELGMVIATAVMGKETESLGDELDRDDLTKATTWLEYDLFRWKEEGKPAVVHTAARETHASAQTRWMHSYSYSDGSGREVMKKVQAEPGDAPERDQNGQLVYANGELVLAPADPRWVGTGRTVFDNKGNPVKKYEPFFSATSEYETDEELVKWGVTPILHYDPLGRLVRTELPNGSYGRADFTPWQQLAYDENDTMLEEGNLWYAARQPNAAPEPSEAEQRAASVTAVQQGASLSPPVLTGTPTVTHFDSLGRPFLVVQDNSAGELFETRTVLDIEGNPRTIIDALGRDAMVQRFDMLGTVAHTDSIDAGERWMLTDVLGAVLCAWDSRDHAIRRLYDDLRRPTHLYVKQGAGAEELAELTVYGEGIANPTVKNHRGRVYEQHDGAGRVRFVEYDFKGNVAETSRQLALAYQTLVDWSADDADDLVESETFSTTTAYDAINRPTVINTPDHSVRHIEYNEAGLLERVEVNVRGAQTATTFVDDVAYNAKGQREVIVYGNGTRTEYTYDPLTFRLARILTTRDADSPATVLQDLRYTYDPVGNIVAIEDGAQQAVFFNNSVVEASGEYEYDAVYRLVTATGREHRSLAEVPRDQNDVPVQTLPHENDSQAVRRYEERYEYDAVGNISKMVHDVGTGNTGSWTRGYRYAATSNRLEATNADSTELEDPESYSLTYTHDAHGNMTVMPHLDGIAWDFKDQMRSADKGGGGDVYFAYDASGQRVRKVWEHSGIVEERIYLGSYEIYRRYESGSPQAELNTERQTLHVMDDQRRIAMVETLTWDGGSEVQSPTPRYRFQLDNHLGSAMLELDEVGDVISYEEYHPYGTTAYWSAASGVEVSQRRYRYTGKEKDEETGLYYHGARYYAPWLGRWTAADPKGIAAGVNLYAYVRGNPILLNDPTGMDPPFDFSVLTPAERGEGLIDLEALKATGEILPGPALKEKYPEPPPPPDRLLPGAEPEHTVELAFGNMFVTGPLTILGVFWSGSPEGAESVRGYVDAARPLKYADEEQLSRGRELEAGMFTILTLGLGGAGAPARVEATISEISQGLAAREALQIEKALATAGRAGGAEVAGPEVAEQLYGPYTHHLNKGGLGNILRESQMTSSEGWGGNAVRAYDRELVPLGDLAQDDAFEFYTTRAPDSVLPSGETRWYFQDDGRLDITVTRIAHTDGSLTLFLPF